ncbi:MAG TPA: hypothetical protein VGS78_11620 [Candidatus Sulfotelmatobacter sp.]|nr:hypothetical protein [Candidatus Sulfotelmatobacter sp.]
MLGRIFAHPRFLAVYSGLVTLAFAVTVCVGFLGAAQGSGKVVEFDRIRVHRIDVVEPNGTPRMIIADRAEYPGSFYHGREIARPDRSDSAGMLFLNDEGTEDGGLIYGGATEDGKRSSFSHLSFDQYEQDQTVVMGTALDPDGTKTAGISLDDRPEEPITPEVMDEAEKIKAMPHGDARAAAWAAYQKKHPFGEERAALLRDSDGSVGLNLKDEQGRVRLRMSVKKDGDPVIELLDEKGQVRRSISIAAVK